MKTTILHSLGKIARVHQVCEAGFGSYFLTTHLNYNGNVKSGMVSLGSNIAVNYLQPVSNKVQIALEGKWLNAFQTKDNMLALQLQVVWRFLDY